MGDKDLLKEVKAKVSRRVLVWRMSQYEL